VEFEEPEEVVLLPESIEKVSVLRGALSLRTEQHLSNFRRFLTKSEIRTTGY
jgi:hypothetical protein